MLTPIPGGSIEVLNISTREAFNVDYDLFRVASNASQASQIESILVGFGIEPDDDNVCRLAFQFWTVTKGRCCGWAFAKYNAPKREVVDMAPEDGIYHVNGMMVWRRCPETVEVRKGDRCLWLGQKEQLFESSDAWRVAEKVSSALRAPSCQVKETLARVLHRVANQPFIGTVDHIVIKKCQALVFGMRGYQEEHTKHPEELMSQANRESFVRHLMIWFGIKDTPNARVKLDARIKEWL